MEIRRTSRPALAGRDYVQSSPNGEHVRDENGVQQVEATEERADRSLDARKPRSGLRPPRVRKCVSLQESQGKKSKTSDTAPLQGGSYPYLNITNLIRPVLRSWKDNRIIFSSTKTPVGRSAAFTVPAKFWRLQNHLEPNPPVLPEEIALIETWLAEFFTALDSATP